MPSAISTEELHLAYRIVSQLATENPTAYVNRLIYEASADLLRAEYRDRTRHDPLPGQLDIPVSTS